MDFNTIRSYLRDKKIEFAENEPMRNHTTFKIGGNADFFVTPTEETQIIKLNEFCLSNNIRITVLGNGSNILVADDGIDGIVLSLSKYNGITVNGSTVTAKSGAKLSAVCNKALKYSLSGLEFAYGIPASVGGALFMNAGAYGGETADVVQSATVLFNNKVTVISAKDMCLGYRHSIFKDGNYIILSVDFLLMPGNKIDIKNKMDDLISRRREKQPLEYGSAGSTFKRPKGNYAAALIDQSGLKGYSVGDAQVSSKHAGFVVNTGNAKCSDVLKVIEDVKRTVKQKTGYELEPEVIYLGRSD